MDNTAAAKETIYKIQELNLQLTDDFDSVTNSYSQIRIRGEIIDCRMCKGILVQFVIKDGDNFMNKFKCKAWARNGIDLQLILSRENSTCIVVGNINQNYWCGGRDFVLELTEDIIFDSDNSKMKELKKECDMRGYFKDKKPIVWSSIKKIGLISKKDTQGYNDFMKQFKIPLEIITKEIALEGDNTEETLINSVNELQGVVDVILVIRGGGSTMDISSSFDRISIFECMKRSKVPIITAIGHEADKDDKLLITCISDYDYPTPTRAAIELNRVFKDPYIRRLNGCLELLENTFTETVTKLKEDEYAKLRNLFDCAVKERFGARIIELGADEDVLIMQKDGIYYKMKVSAMDLSNPVLITNDSLEYKKIIETGIHDRDIDVIEENIMAFVTDVKVLLSMNESIKVIKRTEKLEDKLEYIEPKKYKSLYCKCKQFEMTDCNKLLKQYSMYLWYQDVLERFEDDSRIIKEIMEFLDD